MQHEFIEVLSWFLKLEHKDNSLLTPVRSLEKVISLEIGGVGMVRVTLIETRGAEIPNFRIVHHVETEWNEHGEVGGGVGLFHETGDFSFFGDSRA